MLVDFVCGTVRKLSKLLDLCIFRFHSLLSACEMCFCFSQTNCVMNKISFSWSVNCALFLLPFPPTHLSFSIFLNSFTFSLLVETRTYSTRYWHGVTATFKRRIDTCLHRIRPVISISMPSPKYYVNKIVVCIQNEAVIKMTGFTEKC